MRNLLAFLIALTLATAACARTPSNSGGLPAASRPAAAAAQGIDVLRQLASQAGYGAFGFSTADDVRRASVGEPIAVYIVPLDLLRNYVPGHDPNALIQDSGRLLYRVVVGSSVRSLITVVRQGDGWRAVSFGEPELARRLPLKAAPGTVLIDVSALNLSFLGSRRGQRWFLTPLVSDDTFQLKEGVSLQASAVLGRLVPLARRYNGLPI